MKLKQKGKKTPSVNHAQGSRCLSKQGATSLNRVGSPRCPHLDKLEKEIKKKTPLRELQAYSSQECCFARVMF